MSCSALIVDATNEKAMEFVVRERAKGPLRAPTEVNPLDEFNLEPGPHSRHRAPAMVTDPLTVDELLRVGVLGHTDSDWGVQC
jgi:hypothetical protein